MPTGESLDLMLRLFGFVMPVVGGLAIWSVTKYVRLLHVEKEAEQVRKDRDAVNAQLAEARQQHEATRLALTDRYDRLRAAHQEARDKFYKIKKAYLELRGKPAEPALPGDDTIARLAALEVERDEARRQAEQAERQLQDATRIDGKLWLRPPAGPVPPFRSRTERKGVIVSVLNLKGGVGKTTLTANLAATLARPDAPVLVIDLDYQRSLSMLLVGDQRRKELHGNQWSVQHFLRGPHHRPADLTGRIEDLSPEVPHCAILTNSDAPAGGDAADSLEETENRLMVEWLFDRNRPDPRFFLREALHHPELTFGYVLLDCPPRLTTACVNALAASDFVLIPTLPDSVSTHAVENLLWTLREFRDGLIPDLAVAGVVPNMLRLRLKEPTEAHAAALRELRDGLTGVWPEPVPIFKTGIKFDSAFGVSAAELDATGKLRLAVSDTNIGESFRALAQELEKEFRRHASRRSAAIPAKPAARARSGR